MTQQVLREKCIQPQDECGLTLHEAILGGALQRPIHYSELVLDVTLKWGNWGEEDTKFEREQYEEMRAEGRLQPDGSHVKYLPEHGPLSRWCKVQAELAGI